MIRFDTADFGLIPTHGVNFKRDLEQVRSKVLEYKLVGLNAKDHIPQASDVQPWAEFYTRYMITHKGVANIISDYGDDFPDVGVLTSRDTYRVKAFGCSYNYSRKELQQSGKGVVPLAQEKPKAARRVIEEALNEVQWHGELSGGLFGVTSFPYIDRYIAATTFDGSAAPDDVLAELHNIADRPYLETKAVAQPNVMLVSPRVNRLIYQNYRAGGVSTTIAEDFLKASTIESISAIQELAGAGPAGEDLIFVFRNEEDYLSHAMVELFTQLEAHKVNEKMVTNCIAQTGGISSAYPREAVIAMVNV